MPGLRAGLGRGFKDCNGLGLWLRRDAKGCPLLSNCLQWFIRNRPFPHKSPISLSPGCVHPFPSSVSILRLFPRLPLASCPPPSMTPSHVCLLLTWARWWHQPKLSLIFTPHPRHSLDSLLVSSEPADRILFNYNSCIRGAHTKHAVFFLADLSQFTCEDFSSWSPQHVTHFKAPPLLWRKQRERSVSSPYPSLHTLLRNLHSGFSGRHHEPSPTSTFGHLVSPQQTVLQ